VVGLDTEISVIIAVILAIIAVIVIFGMATGLLEMGDTTIMQFLESGDDAEEGTLYGSTELIFREVLL